jgi:hypothetical protein
MDKYIEVKLDIKNLPDLRLRFHQKIVLVENIRSLGFFKEPLKAINQIRNKLAHTLDPQIDLSSLSKMRTIVEYIYRDEPINNDSELIEKFTIFFATFLKTSYDEKLTEYHLKVQQIFHGESEQ